MTTNEKKKMEVKFYCLNKKKSYMAHRGIKHCLICDNEPAFRYTMKDHRSNARLTREYLEIWKPRYCKNCGKLRSKYLGNGVRKTSKNYVLFKYCNSKCKYEYLNKKERERIDKAPQKICSVCGKKIDKSKYKKLQVYLRVQTCGNWTCRAKINKASRNGRFEGKITPELRKAFAKIDERYES